MQEPSRDISLGQAVETAVQWLPCKIDYEGPADIDEYFVVKNAGASADPLPLLSCLDGLFKGWR